MNQNKKGKPKTLKRVGKIINTNFYEKQKACFEQGNDQVSFQD